MKQLFIFILLLMIMSTLFVYADTPDIGSTITFAGHQWLVLDTNDNQTLIISEQIMEQKAYHETGFLQVVNWENCNLRDYLNNDYFNTKFTQEEKSRIVATSNSNPANPWYIDNWSYAPGGKDTTDKIFLLSIDEVVRYFGDSGDIRTKKRWVVDSQTNGYIEYDIGNLLNDKYNIARKASDVEGKPQVWWLRSTGANPASAVPIYDDGIIIIDGLHMSEAFGIRPAMWVKF